MLGLPPLKKIWTAKSDFARHSVSISWDKSRNCFVAQVVEEPEIVADGRDWDDALLNMKQVRRLQCSIKKLDDAIKTLAAEDPAS